MRAAVARARGAAVRAEAATGWAVVVREGATVGATVETEAEEEEEEQEEVRARVARGRAEAEVAVGVPGKLILRQ